MTSKEENQTTLKEEASTLIPKNEIILMKKGDYTVHILIEEVKNLISIEENNAPSPIIKVICFNEIKRTSKLNLPCNSHIYNEHIYFEKNDLTNEILDSSKIIIEVYDANYLKRKDYFGIYEFDFEYIYNSKNHCIKNLWIALANPESKDITKVNGYLKLSISVLNSNDERVELNPNLNNDSDCMIPPQIKTEYKQLMIYLFKAEELPDMDYYNKEKKVNKECNGFIECHYMGIVKKTKVSDSLNDSVYWNEIIEIPVSQPAISQKIVFYVKDKNSVYSDRLIGSFEISVNDVLNDFYSDISIVNLYGAYNVKSNSNMANLMNTNAEIGSRWKGRVFLKINYMDSMTPIAGIKPIEDKDLINKVNNTSRKHLWSIYIKLFSAYYLPEKDSEYSICFSIADMNTTFKPQKANNRTIDWNLCNSIQYQNISDNINHLPELFIYLLDKKGNVISFQRIEAKSFYLSDDIIIIKLYPEPINNLVKEIYFSGIIKARIKIFNREKDNEYSCNTDLFKDGDENNLNQQSQNRPDDYDPDDLENILKKQESVDLIGIGTSIQPSSYKNYTIVANVYMSRYLISGDSDGTSDPYTIIRIFDKELRTTTKSNCANGIWNQSLIFNDISFDLDNLSTWPIMLITVMDKDLMGDDLLGYTYIWLSDSEHKINTNMKIKPKWEQLYLEKSNKAQGQILLSFYIFDEEHKSDAYNLNIVPETVPYTIEINALGLRDIKPLSFLPVKKAFISFDLNSINVSGKKEDSFEPIKTQPNEAGNNPNINSVIKFNVKLPKDDIFIPDLQCNVYDHFLGGLVNQLLGIFLINIKSVIKGTHDMFKDEYEMTEKIKKEIKKKYNIKKEYIDNSDSLIESDRAVIVNMPENDEIDTSSKKNKVHNENDGLKNIEDPNKNTIEFSNDFICNNPNDLDKVFKGKIDHNLILKNKFKQEYFVIKPSFKIYSIPGAQKKSDSKTDFLIEDMTQIPDSNLYMEIGFNKNDNPIKYKKENSLEDQILSQTTESYSTNGKHYRRYFGKELEKVKELNFVPPFITCQLVRGKYEDKKNHIDIFDALSDIDNKIVKRFPAKKIIISKKLKAPIRKLFEEYDEQEALNSIKQSFDTKPYGHFKGLIRIAENDKIKEHNDFINNIKNEFGGKIPKELSFLNEFDDISRKLLIKRNVIIRIYILTLNHLAKKDTFSESDPYIVIKLGNEIKVNEKNNYQENKTDCNWYKYYDILTELPGNGTLTLQVYDYDQVFKDELIGETAIDLEDRFFDNEWKNIKNKPIETRQLYNIDAQGSQGEVKLWLEIFDKEQRNDMIPWNIRPQPDSLLECRFIIYETEEMENLDIEDTSDIYVLSYIDMKDKHSTDIHYRCQTGRASFNWRNKIPIKLPRNKYDLTIQVYDNDILARDDYICGSRLNLKYLINYSNLLDCPIKLSREYYKKLPDNEKIFSNIEFLSKEDDKEGTKFWIQMEKNGKKGGRVLCSLEILPEWYSNINPVGKGRDEPNVNPYLPQPFGRLTFTMNPLKMFNQLVGPKFRKKCCVVLCCACVVFYLIFVVPYALWFISGELFNPFNYIKKKNEKNI